MSKLTPYRIQELYELGQEDYLHNRIGIEQPEAKNYTEAELYWRIMAKQDAENGINDFDALYNWVTK